ncbi:coiled-coil domain-containing protein 22 [Sulfuriroseicoccus oceanibius]|uniref:Uncharacterized protein n=1 Tax=Sulfuriroseicoccus oceanibius TaxID=2707525 RepID=A0A6B3L7P5_9BACT|nr:coiled-coil domain-containing protein 22 [Sulfuriroseicoccus oceanibius]QQL43759.1 hypothetical protein G3M56_007550 [Sulfuriroseicoccus oceanibius]
MITLSYINIPPTLSAIIVGAVGVIGMVAALIAWRAIAVERDALRKAKRALVLDSNWKGAFAENDEAFERWLKEREINQQSHVSDAARTAWTSWYIGRPTSLSEFHSASVKRERARKSLRIASGIATSLLVLGIVGTLLAIKPILAAFRIKTTANGELQGVADSANLVSEMIQSLGGAFTPSLVALGFTLLVLLCRGFYSIALHSFIIDLDRFTQGTLLTRFRVEPLHLQLSGVTDQVKELTDEVGERERKFEEVIKGLRDLLGTIAPAMALLRDGVGQAHTAARSLSDSSSSLNNSLTDTFGEKSPLHNAITGFNDTLDTLAKSVSGISSEATKSNKRVAKSIDNFETTLRDIESALSDIPSRIENATEIAASEVFNQVGAKVSKVAEKFENDTKATLADVTKKQSESIEELRTASHKLAESADQVASKVTSANQLNRELVGDLKTTVKEQLNDVHTKLDANATTMQTVVAEAKESRATLEGTAARLADENEQLSEKISEGVKSIERSAEEIKSRVSRRMRLFGSN